MRKIMVVDDNVTNLNVMRRALGKDYEIFPMLDGQKALKILKRIKPDLILLDVEMPEMDGFEVIDKIKYLGKPFYEIPVIFVTAKDDTISEYEGLNLGAVDYITKPFSFPLLCKRVELHLKLATQQKELLNYSTNLENMVDAQTDTIQRLQYSIVHVLSNMVERRDGSTGAHLVRTSEYLKILLRKAKEMNVYQDELKDANIEVLAHASKLHDIGKIAIPDGILLKEGRLSDYEFEIMKTHTLEGEKAILSALDKVENSEFLKVAAEFISSHHERLDGSGYPRGLKGEEIPLCGRLMAVVDVYDALISMRTYKPFYTHEDAVKIMIDGAGIMFDAKLIEVFREVTEDFKQISDEYNDQKIDNYRQGDLYDR